MLQRLSSSLAQSLRLSSRQFAAYQQGAAFHLSASLDGMRRQEAGGGSDSEDSDNEQENPNQQQQVETEEMNDDLLPRFDISYARNPGESTAAAAAACPALLLPTSCCGCRRLLFMAVACLPTCDYAAAYSGKVQLA